MLLKWFLVSWLLLLAAVDVSGGQAAVRHDSGRVAQSNRSGTWGARIGSGRTLMGTWTAVPDSTGNIVIGTWAIADAQGRTVASGAWSASKATDRWEGAPIRSHHSRDFHG